jgi:hypothetical protein
MPHACSGLANGRLCFGFADVQMCNICVLVYALACVFFCMHAFVCVCVCVCACTCARTT